MLLSWMRRWPWASMIALLASALPPAPVRADSMEETPPHYSVSWVRGRGAEQCPDRRELAGEIKRRLGRRVFASGAPRSLEVHVFRDGGTLTSFIYLRDEHGSLLGSRELESDDSSCESIFSATVLAAALVIDPEADLKPASPSPDEASPAEQQDAAVATTAASGGAALSPAPPAGAPSDPPPAGRSPLCPPCLPGTKACPDATPCRRQRRDGQGVSVRLGVALSARVLPDPAPGLALSVEPSLASNWSATLGALYLAPTDAEVPGAAVFRVGMSALHLGAGLYALRTERHRLLLEAGLLAGTLHVSVLTPVPTKPGDFPCLAAHGGARTQVLLGWGWFLGLGGQAIVPLFYRAFKIEGRSEPVWPQPVVGGVATLGAGVLLE